MTNSDEDASTFMKRGIGLLAGGQADAATIAQALENFDRALEIRRRLPWETVPLLRHGLAACWLNRAEALTMVRPLDADQLALAMAAYDEALALLRTLPLAEDPRFSRRLAIAHQNRGLVLRAQGDSAAGAAIAAFADAIAVLEDEHAALVPDRKYLLGAVWMNLANARASEGTDESDRLAHDAARRALALVADLEDHDANAAEVGLNARHVRCQTLARLLSAETESDGVMREAIHEATDLVDDGLRLARQWETRGVVRFRSVATDLIRFGIRLYAKYQPHFLQEFLAENVDPDQSSAAYAQEARSTFDFVVSSFYLA